MTRRLFAVAVGIAIAMSAATVEAKPRHGKHYAKAHHSQHVKKNRHRHHASARKIRRHARHVRGRATADRGCLVPAARALLARIEAQFGPVQVISTCRSGAVIAGSGRPSLHRYGMAFDFRTPHKAAVVRWLAGNNRGGTMTYRHSNHIHADVGRQFVALGGGSRRGRSYRQAYRNDRGGSVVARQHVPSNGEVASSFQEPPGFRTYSFVVGDTRHASRRRERHPQTSHGI